MWQKPGVIWFPIGSEMRTLFRVLNNFTNCLVSNWNTVFVITTITVLFWKGYWLLFRSKMLANLPVLTNFPCFNKTGLSFLKDNLLRNLGVQLVCIKACILVPKKIFSWNPGKTWNWILKMRMKISRFLGIATALWQKNWMVSSNHDVNKVLGKRVNRSTVWSGLYRLNSLKYLCKNVVFTKVWFVNCELSFIVYFVNCELYNILSLLG